MDTGDMSMSASRGSGRSGPRASLACMNCRQRKIKCRMPDPSATICTSCRSLGLPCVLNKDGDRRKAGSRQHVAALQERLDYLESFIASGQHKASVQSGNIPEPTPITASAGFAPNPGAQMSISAPTSQRPSFDATASIINDQVQQPAGIPATHDPQTAPPTFVDAKPNAPFDNAANAVNATHQLRLDVLTPTTEKESNRLDLDEADGQPRFYGPTSNQHIQRHSIPVESEDISGDEGLSIDSVPLRAVLFSTYWKIQPHSVIVVDNALFLRARDEGVRSEYYSPFLEDALLASATRMSTSSGVRALGAKYVERAKTAITTELERPNTATLQAFLLLSDFEATRGRDRLGYLYSGIGCRLVFDLGLHESTADLVAKGQMSAEEAMFRHTLFLGSFVYDKLWCLYTGRPGTLPNATAEIAHTKAVACGWTGPSTLESWILLCSDMSDVTDILNRTFPIDKQAREQLENLDQRILRRSENLPATLLLNKDRVSDLPSNAYSLHIQLHGIRCVLHRLLNKTANLEPFESPSDADHRKFSKDRSRAIMYENAIQIHSLVTVYRQIFGIEQVITIMLDNSYVAAVVLISHLLRALQQDIPPATMERDTQRLRALADLLYQAQKHYPVTVRMRHSLAAHVENTPMAGMFGNFAKSSQEPKTPAAVTELQPNATGQQTLAEANPDTFDDLNGFRPDMALFEDWEGITGESIFQEMDMQNMMSWALSPSSSRPDTTFQ